MDVLRQIISALTVKLRRGKGRSLEQVEKLSLTPHHALHLVRVEGREILVATHPQGCTLIENMPRERRAGA
jgi:flagellar biogenesis protein FliO